MKLKPFLCAALVAAGMNGTIGAAPVYAQGVPVIDGSNLAKNIEQLQQALADAERQLQQIEQLQEQIQQLTDINGLLGKRPGINHGSQRNRQSVQFGRGYSQPC